MNEYVFPGADASCLLWWVVGQVEAAGFEVKSIDVLGVHYSATIWRQCLNWVETERMCVPSPPLAPLLTHIVFVGRCQVRRTLVPHLSLL